MTRRTRTILFWSAIGGVCGFLVGLWRYSSKQVLGAVDYDYFPAEELKIVLVTVAGVVVGLLAGLFLFLRHRRSLPKW